MTDLTPEKRAHIQTLAEIKERIDRQQHEESRYEKIESEWVRYIPQRTGVDIRDDAEYLHKALVASEAEVSRLQEALTDLTEAVEAYREGRHGSSEAITATDSQVAMYRAARGAREVLGEVGDV